MSKQDRQGYSARPAPYSNPSRSQFRISDAVSIVKNVVPDWLSRWTKSESASGSAQNQTQRDTTTAAATAQPFVSFSGQSDLATRATFSTSPRSGETQFKLPNLVSGSLQRRSGMVHADVNSQSNSSQRRIAERVTESAEGLDETLYEDANSSPPNRFASSRPSRKREHSLNDDDSTSGISSNDGEAMENGRLRPQSRTNGPSRFSQFLERNRRPGAAPAASPSADHSASKRARYLQLAPSSSQRDTSYERAYSPMDGRSSGATTPLFSPRFRQALSVASDQSTITGRLSVNSSFVQADSSSRFAALLGTRLSASFGTQSVASSNASSATLRRRSLRPTFDPHVVSTDFLTPLLTAAQSNANSNFSKSVYATAANRTPERDNRRATETTPVAEKRPSATGSSTAKLILDRLNQLDVARRDRPSGDFSASASANSSALNSVVAGRAATNAAELHAAISARVSSVATVSSNANEMTTTNKQSNNTSRNEPSVPFPPSISFKVPNSMSLDLNTKTPTEAAMKASSSGEAPVVTASPSTATSIATLTQPKLPTGPLPSLFPSILSSAIPSSVLSTVPASLPMIVAPSLTVPTLNTSGTATAAAAAVSEMEQESFGGGGKMRQKRYLGAHSNPMSTSHQFVAGSGSARDDMDVSDRLEMPDLPAVSLPPLTNLPTFRFASPFGVPVPPASNGHLNTSANINTSINANASAPASSLSLSLSSTPATFAFSKPVVFNVSPSPLAPISKELIVPVSTPKLDSAVKSNGVAFTFAKPFEVSSDKIRDDVHFSDTCVSEFRSRLHFCEPLKVD